MNRPYVANFLTRGQQKTGSPPRALARLMLVEVEEDRLGNPMYAQVVHASAQ
jgi:hypothetical protein